MYGCEESDLVIVPKKLSNKSGDNKPLAEAVEGRTGPMENMKQDGMCRTQSRMKKRGCGRNASASASGMSHGLRRVRRVAEEDKSTRFTALLHHITVDKLRESYYGLKKQASPGVDGCMWADYQEGLSERLEGLYARVHKGTYRAQPSRRVYIPKSDDGKRPLGIAALEDKIIQHAVTGLLTAIYEADFYGFSYGFRPGKGCHDALDALVVGIGQKKIHWVLDADIQGFFDSISHEWMIRFLERRIADQRILRLIRKWLKAGVSEDGEWSRSTVGTPQGAVISPLLANVFLHYVLDDWVVWWRKEHASGDVIIVRYADDFVMGFQYKSDAQSFLAGLRKRFDAFELKLHPEKTRLIEFGRFAATNRREEGKRKPETFTFLGFTHICSVNISDGKYKILRLTSKKRMRDTLARIKMFLSIKMHEDIADVGQWLKKVVQGYYNYYAVHDNLGRLAQFRYVLCRIWHRILCRRSQRGRMSWETFNTVARPWIPVPIVLHPYPTQRFCAKHS
jgi:group II intron reverse transcriptase/maturase